MVILFPIIVMFLTALTLIFFRIVRRNFKYLWMLACAGTLIALAGIFAWHLHLPQNMTLAAWQPETLFSFSPTWLADGISWPYALALAALGSTIIWTSIVRAENDPAAWAGTLLLSGLGILAVTAGNPLTLVLVWSALDLTMLFTLLRATDGDERSRQVVIAFAVNLSASVLVVWTNLASIAAGSPLSFNSIPEWAGIYLLIAAGLRLSIFPLNLPYLKQNSLRRGFGSSLLLVSAAASLSLVARIPASALQLFLLPGLIILAVLAASYGGWMWLRASDEIIGRPYWVLGMGALAVAANLQGNATGSTGWGVMLILGGGLLFLFSARQRSILWLPLISIWGISALPFSVTATGWGGGISIPWFYIVPFLPAQALLATGIIRHALHPGETSLESQERWTKFLYPTGLFLLAVVIILLGVWGWSGALYIGNIWAASIAMILAAGFTVLTRTVLSSLITINASRKWTRVFRLDWFTNMLSIIYELFCKVAEIITSSLEGDGGLLWSLLLLALLFSILSSQAR